MKKISMFLLILCVCFTANAQIEFLAEKTYADETMIIGELSANKALNTIGMISSALGGGYYRNGTETKLYCRFYKEHITFGILVITSNSYDDDAQISLGNNFDTTRESLNSLLTWVQESITGQSTRFEDFEGRMVTASKIEGYPNACFLTVHDSNRTIVGPISLTLGYISRGIELLSPLSERKVYEKALELGLQDSEWVKEYEEKCDYNKRFYIEFSAIIADKEAELKSKKEELKIARKEKNRERISTLENEIKTLQEQLIRLNNYLDKIRSEIIIEDF